MIRLLFSLVCIGVLSSIIGCKQNADNENTNPAHQKSIKENSGQATQEITLSLKSGHTLGVDADQLKTTRIKKTSNTSPFSEPEFVPVKLVDPAMTVGKD